MTTNNLAEILAAEVLFDSGKPVKGAYAGDFLSRAIGKAPPGCVWLTVMNNVNVAGVAVLAEIAAVALCEGQKPDPALLEKCRTEGITLLSTPLDMFAACVRLGT